MEVQDVLKQKQIQPLNLEAPAFLQVFSTFVEWLTDYSNEDEKNRVNYVANLKYEISLQKLAVFQLKRLIDDFSNYLPTNAELIKSVMNTPILPVNTFYIEYSNLTPNNELELFHFKKKVREAISALDILRTMNEQWLDHVQSV
jgi:hypothetical protein